jgi:nucleotide-binding universal stress UspA family protein
MQRILLATHGGPGADGAARVAVALARRAGAALDTMVVLETAPLMDAGFGAVWMPSPQQFDEAGKAIQDAAGVQLRRCGAEASVAELRAGVPAVEIATAARARRASLIVVGLGPHDFVSRAMGHETALELAQMASVPVLAVSGDAAGPPHRVVVAIDFTATSVHALRTVLAFAVPGDVIHVAHALPASEVAERREATLRRLEALVRALEVPAGVTIEPAVLPGPPAGAVLEYATRSDADLVALGSHGYGLWKRLTIGSVASKVLRLARRSVLVAPLASLAPAESAAWAAPE